MKVFINDVVTDALDNETDLSEWPTGSIIAKRGYDGDDVKYLALMEKVESDDRFWIERIGGNIDFSRKPNSRVDCHRSGDDFVRAFDLR